MTQKSLHPHRNQIRAWVKQGRTDAWIAHQLEVTVREVELFKRANKLVTDHEIDLLIAAELEAAAAEAERLSKQSEQSDHEPASVAAAFKVKPELAPPRGQSQADTKNQIQVAKTPVIFLVHGHDHNSRDKVRWFLERAGDHKHDIIILDERASKGQTIVEKLEEHASASQYAVVLLTGDDEGGPKRQGGTVQPRARQNVVLELGWFCGQIGRGHVTVLHEPGVELPSDIHGLVYISLSDDWERRLARELRAANLDFSLDRL
jgi:predicted nucleotide-binding protein